MKPSTAFKDVIERYLQKKATQDPLFEESFLNPKKNIDDCITYILNTVQKSGCNGFADEEIFGMAVHYYDEIDIEVGKPINANVVVNHHVELTEEEKAEAKEAAKQKLIDDAYAKMKKPATSSKKTSPKPQSTQTSLFDLLQ